MYFSYKIQNTFWNCIKYKLRAMYFNNIFQFQAQIQYRIFELLSLSAVFTYFLLFWCIYPMLIIKQAIVIE